MQIFNNQEFGQIKIIDKNGEPWFVASDISKALDFRDAYSATRGLDDDEKLLHKLCVAGQTREIILINEPGLYSLIIKSRKPEAKKFKRWVTHEVLPSIRKTGQYDISQDSYMIEDPIQRAKKWIKEQEEKQVLIEQVKRNKSKVLFAEAVSASKNSILVRELATILKQNGIDTGQNRLYTWLRDNGYLIKRKGTDHNMPTQKSMELELFEIKETSIVHSDESISISKTPKVTGKGSQYFVNKLKSMELIEAS